MKSKHEIIETIKSLQHEVHTTAVAKGWWKERSQLIDQSKFGRKQVESTMLMLTVSELVEGMKGLRKDLKDDHIPEFLMIEAELADAIIRILDHAEAFNYRLGEALIAKLAYNETRPQFHGGKAF